MFRLQSVLNPEKILNIPKDKAFYLGRSEITGIDDVFVSRKQLECTANYDSNLLTIKPLGKNCSGCNGYALMKDGMYNLQNEDIIEVRLGFHPFKVITPLEKNDDAAKVKETKKHEILQECLSQKRKNAFEEVMNFKHRSPKVSFTGNWESIDNNELLIYTPESCESRSDIASFDMDGTIITTKSGARFPKDSSDWQFLFKSIPNVLQDLHNDNFKIVFFTNQAGLNKDVAKIRDFKKKIEAVVGQIGVPIQVFIALGRSIYRKPCPGMWTSLKNHKNNGIDINIKKSFFVGDAAGREKNWMPKKNKDHSICDRLFAININIAFYTPEEYFLKSKSVLYKMPEFDPRQLSISDYPSFSSNSREVIVMVGLQGSGKSYFCKTELISRGYIHINRDNLKSWQKCVQLLEETLQKNKSAVIDNTNPDKSSRERYIEIAKKFNVSCRCFVMSTSISHCKHNNRFRELTDKSRIPVADLLINSYKKKFEKPEKEEGFTEIIEIPFVPKFKTKADEELYKMFLMES